MNFFRLIRSGIDVRPMLDEIYRQEHAWLLNTKRQETVRVQRNTNTILLSRAVRRPDLNINENQEVRLTQVSEAFPLALAFMQSVAAEMSAHLSRASIVRLKPHSKVFRHIDTGSYYLLRDRYHLVLSSPAGSVLISADEQVRMQAGELWWFDNKQYHEAYNESDEWRIHYIFDLLPIAHSHLARNALLPAPPTVESSAESSSDTPPVHSARAILHSAIREQAIIRDGDQRLVSRKGGSYKWLIDMRRILTQANFLSLVADLFWEQCGDRFPFQVGGMEVAAIPILSAILMKSAERGTPVNAFIVRKERKNYGTGSLIEGTITDAPIVIVDDILNSGHSIEKLRVALKHEKKTIVLAFFLIDYQAAKGEAWKSRHGIEVCSVFKLSEFGLALEKTPTAPDTAIFEEVWHFASPRPNFFHRVPKSFPIIDGNRVYFGGDSGVFWCINARDGSVVWEFKTNPAGDKGIWSSPALNDGRVFFGGYDGNVYCLDAATGAEVWRFIGADWVGSSPAIAPDLGLLFIGLEFAVEKNRGSIAALSLESGEKIWEHRTKRYTHASPAYWQERRLVACGSNDDEMFLFDAATGAIRWRFQTRPEGGTKGSIRHAPAFDRKRGQLITGCADGRIYVIDIDTGREAWSLHTGNTIYTVPLVVDDAAYIGSTDKCFYILDLERQTVKKKIHVGSKVFGPPRLIDGRIYFGSCSGLIFEIDPATAQVMGTHQLPDAITNPIIHDVENGLFYALTYVNELFALKPSPLRKTASDHIDIQPTYIKRGQSLSHLGMKTAAESLTAPFIHLAKWIAGR